jgi:membrane protease YdiL (CAAX protease family)
MMVLTVTALLIVFGWQILGYLCTLLPVPAAVAATAGLVVAILWLHAGIWRRGLEGRTYREAVRVRWLSKGAMWMILSAVPPMAAAAFCIGTLWVHVTGISMGGESAVMNRAQSQPYGWLKLMMAMGLIGPLIEELMFRGRIQGAFERKLGPVRGILITAVIFSVAHFASYKLPGSVLTGIVFGAAVHLTGSIWSGVLLHTANNGLGVVLAFGMEEPRWTGPGWPLIVLLASLLALIAIGSRLPRWR